MIEVFVKEIEKIKRSKNINYMEAVILFSEKYGYEIESVALLVKKDPVLSAKIKNDAEISNLLKNKGGSRLPL